MSRGTTEKFCHSDASAVLRSTFFFIIKEQKKPVCLLQNVSSTVFVSEIFLLLQREISLFQFIRVCVHVCVCVRVGRIDSPFAVVVINMFASLECIASKIKLNGVCTEQQRNENKYCDERSIQQAQNQKEKKTSRTLVSICTSYFYVFFLSFFFFKQFYSMRFFYEFPTHGRRPK